MFRHEKFVSQVRINLVFDYLCLICTNGSRLCWGATCQG